MKNKIEYKIASILYTAYDYKIQDYTEMETVNHIFIKDKFEMPSLYTKDKIAISLCHHYKNGIMVSEFEDTINIIDDTTENKKSFVSFESLEDYFTPSKHQKTCKLCSKKLKVLERG